MAAAELGVLFGVCVLVVGTALGPQGVGRLVALGRAADQLAAAVPDDGRVPAGAALRRPGGPKLAAALALFAAIDVPLVYKSVDIWRTVHPKTTVVPDAWIRACGRAFWSAFLLITLVWALLLMLRVRLRTRARRAGGAAPGAEDLAEERR